MDDLPTGVQIWRAVRRCVEQGAVACSGFDFESIIQNFAVWLEEWKKFSDELFKDCGGPMESDDDRIYAYRV